MTCICQPPAEYPHFSPLCPQHGKLTPTDSSYDDRQIAHPVTACTRCGADWHMPPGKCAGCRGL